MPSSGPLLAIISAPEESLSPRGNGIERFL
jgi:hypothetical protein